ncbi:MAG: hypothetical protein FWH10_07725 [Oscillospiraceae bacterium]|nr:hypothetical protein [Oscillospiraceae bacterium]
MKYEKIKKYKDGKFRRITGVKRVAFEKMIEILKAAYAKKHKRRGRRSKLTITDTGFVGIGKLHRNFLIPLDLLRN